MKKNILLLICLTGFSLVQAAPKIFAQNFILPIEVKSYRQISYVTGGIGVDERNVLQKMGKNYGLKLMFAATDKSYLSDLTVHISNIQGKEIFEAVSDGPLLYVDLVPGDYTVAARIMNQTIREKVTLMGGKQVA
ncbi:MAG: hypothetical protein Q8P24_11025, partial [Desulfobacterales bacterium]|nr:hypothetical protein [Desulfobacterales bacterium]